MAQQTPKITAVVPYYNMGRYVKETVDCLLNQTWRNMDIVIVNDGSTDEEREALSQFADHPRIAVIHKTNAGVSAARNDGIAAASGKYILALDADDLLDPTFAEKAVSVLEADENISLVESHGHYFGDRKGPMNRQPINLENVLAGVCHCGYGMFRKSDWAAAGGYCTEARSHGDFDFWLSLLELGKRAHRIDEALYRYRRHNDSILSRLRRSGGSCPIELILSRHKALYARHPEIAERLREIAGMKDLPKFMAIKSVKYKLILLAAKTPGLSGLLRRSAGKAANKLEYYASLEKFRRAE